jgi:hypothetical protein
MGPIIRLAGTCTVVLLLAGCRLFPGEGWRQIARDRLTITAGELDLGYAAK